MTPRYRGHRYLFLNHHIELGGERQSPETEFRCSHFRQPKRPKRLCPIRHSLGCQLLDEGHDLSLVQEVLGHRRQEMTRRYEKRTAKKIGQVRPLVKSISISGR